MRMSSVHQLLHVLLFLTLFVASKRPEKKQSKKPPTTPTFLPRLAVANRGKGEGLLIESQNENSLLSIKLEDTSEPMYISASTLTDEFYIGDRNNSQLYVYDMLTLEQVDIIHGCNGIFHQFYNELNQLWIVCDIDLTLLVIDTKTRTKLKTVKIKHIRKSGFKPHDLTSSKKYTYVSLLKPDDIGIVIQYSNKNFKEIKRIKIGGDPHLFINPCLPNPKYLYIASQGAGLVYKVDATSMKVLKSLSISGAHGIWGSEKYLYVTNIAATDGTDSLNVINLNNFKTIRRYDSVVGSAHNLMINYAGDKLFVTHSGPGIVTVYDIDSNGGLKGDNRIVFEEEGSVPFGVMSLGHCI